MIETPTNTVMYSIEKAIKSYRKFALQNIRQVEKDLTVDQALILFLIKDNPSLSQVEMADILFKDYASITRMIELMVKNEYIIRVQNPNDRRRSSLTLSIKGDKSLANVLPVIAQNRRVALEDVSEEEQEILKTILSKMIKNCSIEKASYELTSKA